MRPVEHERIGADNDVRVVAEKLRLRLARRIEVLLWEEAHHIAILIPGERRFSEPFERDDDFVAAQDVILICALGAASGRGKASFGELLPILLSKEAPRFGIPVVPTSMPRKTQASLLPGRAQEALRLTGTSLTSGRQPLSQR